MSISAATRTDHSSYVACWLRVLGQDARALVSVAVKAQAAVDYLNTLAGYFVTVEAGRPNVADVDSCPLMSGKRAPVRRLVNALQPKARPWRELNEPLEFATDALERSLLSPMFPRLEFPHGLLARRISNRALLEEVLGLAEIVICRFG